jgi:hypothetical protein
MMTPERCVYKALSRILANRMGDFFGGLRSGIQFPQVVMNQGPLPGSGGLPQPLHETPDARINYNSSLLGNLSPYAYGEPGYLSSQNAYLNIPHKIQKIIPVIYLPEAKQNPRDIIDVSHPIDDGDIAFVLRLDRSSMFCTGLKNGSMRRAGLGTAIDPFINLCTLNYILSGMQLAVNNDVNNLWAELMQNLDKDRFGRQAGAGRDYSTDPITVNDVIHVIRHCIRPFGITRGSEKQGGQDEATLSAATWPVNFVASLTVDGKESNVLNIWHNHDMSAGEDLVLRLKPMPIRTYTLNHYYKSVKKQTWDKIPNVTHVWQLVPDLLNLEPLSKKEMEEYQTALKGMPQDLKTFKILPKGNNPRDYGDLDHVYAGSMVPALPWQEMGYWHIGRSQIMTGKYGVEEYWHNDLANSLRTNHLDLTFQPIFQAAPFTGDFGNRFDVRELEKGPVLAAKAPKWEAKLGLEQLKSRLTEESRARQVRARQPAHIAGEAAPFVSQSDLLGGQAGLSSVEPVVVDLQSEGKQGDTSVAAVTDEEEPDWLGRLEFTDDDQMLSQPQAPIAVEGGPASKRSRGAKRGKSIGGSLLRVDGTSEPSMVGML